MLRSGCLAGAKTGGVGLPFAKLIVRYNVACRIEDTLQIKKVDEEFFE